MSSSLDDGTTAGGLCGCDGRVRGRDGLGPLISITLVYRTYNHKLMLNFLIIKMWNGSSITQPGQEWIHELNSVFVNKEVLLKRILKSTINTAQGEHDNNYSTAV